MREIKFRAWDNSTKKMYYNSGLTVTNNNIIHMDGEIMQFTGLKDAEGVEVYEGDILTHPEFRTNVVVEWKHGCWHLSGWDVIRTPITPGKVIGNIFENPELLTS